MKKYSIVVLLFLCLNSIRSQNALLWNFNTINKANLVYVEKDSIYDYARKEWIYNYYTNLIGSEINSILFREPPGGSEIDCFERYKKSKTSIKFYHQPLDSSGRLQGQFYYTTLDSFILVSGSFVNDTLEGYYIENLFKINHRIVGKMVDSCFMRQVYNYEDSGLISYSPIYAVDSFQIKSTTLRIYNKGVSKIAIIQNMNSNKTADDTMIICGNELIGKLRKSKGVYTINHK